MTDHDPKKLQDRLARLARALDQLPCDPKAKMLLGAEAVAAHQRSMEARLGRHLLDAGVPPGIASRVAEGLSDKGYPAVPVVRAWSRRSDAPMLLMGGGVGSGKSCAAAEALRLARRPATIADDAGVMHESWQWATSRALFVSAARLSSQSSWSDEGSRLWERARTAAVLVIDDLGVESLSERGPFFSDLHDLVDARYQDETKRTVITTNLEGKAFVDRYGARVLSRIRERGIACSVGRDDLRGRVA